MGDVVKLPVWTKLPLDPNCVLNGAIDKMEYVLLLGWDKDGKFYAASSSGDMERTTYVAQRFIHKEHAGEYG